MPVYPFECPGCKCYEERFLTLSRYKRIQKCPKCKKRMSLLLAVPNAKKDFFNSKEKRYWEQATGKQFANAHELDGWLRSTGKAVVEKGFKPPPPSPIATDAEIEYNLDKVYRENHSLGEIR